MKHHTFVCGTAKSKREDRYYIKAKNRFWRSLHEAGIGAIDNLHVFMQSVADRILLKSSGRVAFVEIVESF